MDSKASDAIVFLPRADSGPLGIDSKLTSNVDDVPTTGFASPVSDDENIAELYDGDVHTPREQGMESAVQERPVLYTLEGAGRNTAIEYAFRRAQIPFTVSRIRREDWPAFKGFAPLGTSPFLEVNGRLIPETAAILMWVAAVGGMLPANSEDMAIARSLHDEITACFDEAVARVFGHLRPKVEEQHAPGEIEGNPDDVFGVRNLDRYESSSATSSSIEERERLEAKREAANQLSIAKNIERMYNFEIRLAAVYPSRNRPRHAMPCGVTYADCSIAGVYHALVATPDHSLHLEGVTKKSFPRMRRIYERIHTHPVIQEFTNFEERYATADEACLLPPARAQSYAEVVMKNENSIVINPPVEAENQQIVDCDANRQFVIFGRDDCSRLELALYELILGSNGHTAQVNYPAQAHPDLNPELRCWFEYEDVLYESIRAATTAASVQKVDEATKESVITSVFDILINLVESFLCLHRLHAMESPQETHDAETDNFTDDRARLVEIDERRQHVMQELSKLEGFLETLPAPITARELPVPELCFAVYKLGTRLVDRSGDIVVLSLCPRFTSVVETLGHTAGTDNFNDFINSEQQIIF